ncbi:hypothetical protein FACS1894177_07120 [Bacteroidia bacterium]|nr:hypothetical protein FACS1894177_07120 [Bacteroidia bacterium]
MIEMSRNINISSPPAPLLKERGEAAANKVQGEGYTVHDRYWQPYTVYRVPCTLYLLPFTLYLLLLFCSCENRELSADDPCGDAVAVEVVIHWDGIDPADKPQKGMTAHLFAQNDRSRYERANLPVDGGRMNIPVNIPYIPLCYDYYGNEYIHFHNENSLDLFEAYSAPATGLYNSYGPNSAMNRAASGEPEEKTVFEPYPYNFFVTRNDSLFTVRPLPGQTQYLHFYPQNVLREFTFLIRDVEGVENISSASGAISGMSAAYRMSDGVKGSEPATVLFGNLKGRVIWADDSITGVFCTFGPADIEHLLNRLTVGVVSVRHGYYYGTWEETVREQIAGALGEHGTWEEQAAWRLQNEGYDIVLQNEGRLVIPDEPGDGTFIIDVGDYDNVVVPLPVR